MLSLSFIRNNRDLIIERLNKRNFDSKKLVDKIIKFDLERRKIIAVLEEKQAKGNLIAKKISELYKFGKNIEAEKLKLESKDLKADSKKNQLIQECILKRLFVLFIFENVKFRQTSIVIFK